VPVPHYCSNPNCPNYSDPQPHWLARFGSYPTAAHGTVRRYRCKICHATVSDQTESIYYFAKRRVPLRAATACLNSGSSLREIARRYRVSSAAVRTAVLRLGRQAMAAQIIMLAHMDPRTDLVFDGLRSFVTSQDFPCDITTVVDARSEVILTMAHSIFIRGGTMTVKQKRRLWRKLLVWRPEKGSMKRDIQLLVKELWDYLRPRPEGGSIIDTDEHRMYPGAITSYPVGRHYLTGELVQHRQTPGRAPRTFENPLFPVNNVDRMLRHRVKEHTRETIAFGRHAVVQMHRAWIFAWDFNMRREYRVKRPEAGVHAEQGVIERGLIRKITREFFRRRLSVRGLAVPATIRRVWEGRLATPPVRWRKGQSGTAVRVPGYALRDLAEGILQFEESGLGMVERSSSAVA